VNERNVVVDTNIIFSFLLPREPTLRRVFLTDKTHEFFCPRFLFVELFHHKERIVRATHLGEDQSIEALQELLARIEFVDEGGIPVGTWVEARRLFRDVDPKDTPFVALALHLDGLLWTADEGLKAGLLAKGFDRLFKT
jgi:predicted nucleic acid-binding protein